MSHTEEIKVQFFASSDHKTSSSLQILQRTPKERTVRAIKFMLASWLAAIVSVLVPVAHFVLVPLFLILGPVIFFIIKSESETLLPGEGECPFCHQPLKIVGGKVRWPFFEICEACKKAVRVERVISQ